MCEKDEKCWENVFESSIFYCLGMITFIANLFASMNKKFTVKLTRVFVRYTIQSTLESVWSKFQLSNQIWHVSCELDEKEE